MLPKKEAESLAERFAFKGRIAHYDLFAVFAAAYFDESGNFPRHRRIAVAAGFANLSNWQFFEAGWSKALEVPGGGRFDFHAKGSSHEQRALNILLVNLMQTCGVAGYCITVDEADFLATTTKVERSLLGNAYGFASFACVSLFAGLMRQADSGDAGYYIEQGGPGVDKTMQLLADVYASDEWRRDFRLAEFSLVDRRRHLPVHVADLIAHEVATARDTSHAVRVMEPSGQLEIHDLTKDEVRALVDDFNQLWLDAKQQRARRRNALKREKRRLKRDDE